MHPDVIDNLREFNRKERFFLVAMALGNPEFALPYEFRQEIGDTFSLNVTKDAFAAMDYHLDWIYASLFLASHNGDKIYSNKKKLIHATQEDIDFLIAFHEGGKCHLMMLEAKGVTGFTNKQSQSKKDRLKSIFGDTGDNFPGIVPHFAIVSPRPPSRIQTGDWPSWMLKDGEIRWIKLPFPSVRKRVTRCDDGGIPDARGKCWKVVTEHY